MRLPSIELCGIVMQRHAGQFQGTFTGDFSILDHARQGNGQGFAGLVGGLPANFLPIDLRGVGVEVGAEQCLLRIPFQPVPNYLTQLAGGDEPGLLGEIGVHIGLHQQIVSVFRVRRRPAVDQDEVSLS